MKVLHIVSNLSIRNGVMAVLMNYYRNIDTSIIQFGFMYFDEVPETYEEEIKQLGGEIFKIARVTRLKGFRNDINAFSKEHFGEYQILHIHEIYITGFFWRVKKQTGIKKIIVHSHATRFSDHKLKEIRNQILSEANRFLPDYYFACSKKAGQIAFKKRFDKVGIVINNAINTDNFYPDKNLKEEIKKSFGLEGKFVIGHIGNFTPQKNHSFLINVFECILKRNNNAVLVLIGDGHLREQVLNNCKTKNIDKNILYLGTRSDVHRVIHCFDKFLFPSVYEGLGIVLIEAQSVGIPCVFSDVIPKEANILQECNRVLSLNDDADEWAEAVLENNEIKIDEVTKKIMEAGYSIKTEADKLQKIYQRILTE